MSDAARRADSPPALTSYLVLGFVALLLALVARAPASLLQKAVSPSLPFQVSAWGGTLWSGQAAVQAGEPGFWRWQTLPLSLLRGRLALQLDAAGPLDLHGRVERGVGGWAARGLHGTVPGRLVQPVLPPGWSLPGEVELAGVDLARRGIVAGAWTAAAGKLRWAGGVMQYNLGSQPQSATLPPLVASLRRDGDQLLVILVEEGGGGALADVKVAPDGAVETKLRERLLRYSGRTSGASPDAVVVTSVQNPR